MRRTLYLVLFIAVPACEVGSRPADGGPDSHVVIRCEGTADADGDGMYDEFETEQDWEYDGTPNYLDEDSDGDGYLDAEEHGIPDGCAAIDTDGDGIFDYLDLDSDGDGLSDEEERTRYFTDPRDDDSDGDGFGDLAEVATGHDPADATDRIPDDTFFVVLPYLGEAQERELVFGTNIQKADVFFMVDSTGSMGGEIGNLVSGLDSIVAEMRASLTDVGVGFGQFAGFGGAAGGTSCVPPFGCVPADGPEGDLPFELVQTITVDDSVMSSAVRRLEARSSSGAGTASSTEALFQMATGEGFQPWLGPQRCPAIPDEEGRRYGYPCFRPGALPIGVVLTDTASKNGPGSGTTYDPATFTMSARGPNTSAETLSALTGIGARAIGIISGMESGDPVGQFTSWANDTETVDAAGAPIVFAISSDGSGLDNRIVEAIRILAEETPQDISTESRDGEDRPDTVGPIDARMFIKSITPVSFFDGTSNVVCPMSGLCDDQIFYDVTPGNTVRFRIRFLNDFVEPQSFGQVFLATIVVLGNGVAELDSREVVIVVPSGSIPILI